MADPHLARRTRKWIRWCIAFQISQVWQNTTDHHLIVAVSLSALAVYFLTDPTWRLCYGRYCYYFELYKALLGLNSPYLVCAAARLERDPWKNFQNWEYFGWQGCLGNDAGEGETWNWVRLQRREWADGMDYIYAPTRELLKNPLNPPNFDPVLEALRRRFLDITYIFGAALSSIRFFLHSTILGSTGLIRVETSVEYALFCLGFAFAVLKPVTVVKTSTAILRLGLIVVAFPSWLIVSVFSFSFLSIKRIYHTFHASTSEDVTPQFEHYDVPFSTIKRAIETAPDPDPVSPHLSPTAKPPLLEAADSISETIGTTRFRKAHLKSWNHSLGMYTYRVPPTVQDFRNNIPSTIPDIRQQRQTQEKKGFTSHNAIGNRHELKTPTDSQAGITISEQRYEPIMHSNEMKSRKRSGRDIGHRNMEESEDFAGDQDDSDVPFDIFDETIILQASIKRYRKLPPPNFESFRRECKSKYRAKVKKSVRFVDSPAELGTEASRPLSEPDNYFDFKPLQPNIQESSGNSGSNIDSPTAKIISPISRRPRQKTHAKFGYFSSPSRDLPAIYALKFSRSRGLFISNAPGYPSARRALVWRAGLTGKATTGSKYFANEANIDISRATGPLKKYYVEAFEPRKATQRILDFSFRNNSDQSDTKYRDIQQSQPNEQAEVADQAEIRYEQNGGLKGSQSNDLHSYDRVVFENTPKQEHDERQDSYFLAEPGMSFRAPSSTSSAVSDLGEST